MKNIKLIILAITISSCNSFKSTYEFEYSNGDKESVTCIDCIIIQYSESDCVFLDRKRYCGIRKWKRTKYEKIINQKQIIR